MIKLIVFVTLFVAVFAAENSNNSDTFFPSTDIDNKWDADKNEFPYQVSLQWGVDEKTTHHICGGAIITDQWILTSGYCIAIVPYQGVFVVVAGKLNMKEVESGEQRRIIEERILHGSYYNALHPFDIAMMKLRSPLKFNQAIAPINLPLEGTIPSGTGILTGWGLMWNLFTEISYKPKNMQKDYINIHDFDTCNSAYEKLNVTLNLDNSNFCTVPDAGYNSSCIGDTGGPVAIKNTDNTFVLIGIVTRTSIPCQSTGAPMVYMKVSSFVKWIRDVMDPKIYNNAYTQ